MLRLLGLLAAAAAAAAAGGAGGARADALGLNQGVGVAPAHVRLALRPTADGLHYRLPLAVGGPAAQAAEAVLDTGSDRLVLFEAPFCGEGSRPGPCFNRSASASWAEAGGEPVAFGLTVDGEFVGAAEGVAPYERAEDNASLPFEVGGLGVAAEPLPAVRVEMLRAPEWGTEEGGLHTFAYSHGVIGAARGEEGVPTPFELLLDQFPYEAPGRGEAGAGEPPVFSLDLTNEVEDGTPPDAGAPDRSWLHVGGAAPEYIDRLLWGERRSATASYHELVLHDLELCGNRIMANATGGTSRPALVDTGASCLGLTAELFDAVFAYVPAECDTEHRCYLPSGVSDELPTLSFSLAAGGEQLHVRLKDLLLPLSAVGGTVGLRRRYCIVRGAAASSSRSNTLSLGTRVLTSLYATFHGPRRQVALANKAALEPSALQCRANAVCTGMQWRDATTNTCQDPQCGDYLFFETDHETKTCRLSSAFHGTAIFFIVAVLAAEIALHEYGASLVSRVRKEVPDA